MIARLLISPSLKIRVGEIEKILQEFNLSHNHPDLLYFPNESKLGITEARKIKEHFSFKSFNGKIRGVVLEDAVNLTVEAQNALLKTLEELPEDGLFILGADSNSKLLPTVLSRCQVIILTDGSKYNNNYNDYIENLVNLDLKQRFEYIEKLKDKEEFLYALVWYFHQKQLDRDTPVRINLKGYTLNQFLKELLQAEEWAAQNVNIRAILEYLMLVMPQVV